MSISEIKREARESLKGKWGKAVCIILAYMLITFLLGFVEGLFENSGFLFLLIEIAVIVISAPLSFGLIISFIKLKRGNHIGVFEFIEDGFSNFGKSWGIAWHTFVRLLLPMLCLILILVISLGMTIFNASSSIIDAASSARDEYERSVEQELRTFEQYSTYPTSYSSSISPYSLAPSATSETNPIKDNNSPIFSIIFLILYIIILIFITSKALLYVLAYNIGYDNPELSSKDCVLRSKELMKGNRVKYFLLELSFIGWIILACFTLGIGMLWLAPYMQVAVVCFYDRLANPETNTIHE